MKPNINVIIPAFNEEASIALVINDIPDIVSEVIVVNNNSSDQTEMMAKRAGATVIFEKNKGYGYACLAGINYLSEKTQDPDIVVFLDGDYSDHPEELSKIISPIIHNQIDFVVGLETKN